MSEERRSVKVRIAGEEHVIRAAAEPEYTLRCAAAVDQRISEIRRLSGLAHGHRAAILAALSLVDELFQAQDELARTRRETAERADALVRTLDAALD